MSSINVKKTVISLLIVCLSAFAVYQFAHYMTNWTDPFKSVPHISWTLLQELEPDFVPPIIQDLETQKIKLAGFVVPLTDNFKEIQEFLLVPDSMSCIHVPPPPFNQMVMVKMKRPINTQLAYGPVWVLGQIKIEKLESEFGIVGYQFEGENIKEYNESPW